jgi:thiamine-monophosphate kinase
MLKRPQLRDVNDGPEGTVVARIARALGERRPHGRASLRIAIGDDAAIWKPRLGHETILTADWFLEGSHFDREKHPPDSIGWKCLARAASDIAAMGGEPRCFLLSLALPSSHTSHWLDEFLQGLKRASRQLRCSVAGGDTTRNEKILIGVTVVGEVRKGCALLRSGARPGDVIFVTGRLGEAELGLAELRAEKPSCYSRHPKDSRIRKHMYPEPRLRVGQWLAHRKIATAMMDLSDGLSSDLARLCAASGVGAEIEERQLPLAQSLGSKSESPENLLEAALHGGDDYELLFTVNERIAGRIPRRIAGVNVTRIGTIARRRDILRVRSNGNREILAARGWDPFR